MNKQETIAAIISAVESAESIAIIAHDRPDGDAIGSIVGLGLMLEQVGKRTFILNNDGVPHALSFLPATDKVINIKADPNADIFDVDLIMVLDCAGRDRIHDKVWYRLPTDVTVINIDHHISNTRFGDINLVDTISPATGEIIFELGQAAGWDMTKAIADNLFAAISTDTGSFRYPNTTANTYRVAAGLIDAGVDIGLINQQLYESFPLRRVECIRDLLQGMRLSFDNRCASLTLTRSVKAQLGLQAGDTEGVLEIIRAIDSVVVAVFFEEMTGGLIRVSSRSKSDQINVGQICESFGGGGHKLAAGARIKGTMDSAEQEFLAKVGATLG